MVPLELTMIAVVLPRLEHDLGLGLAGGAWVIDSYMVAFASLLLVAGALADRLGRVRTLLVGAALFGVSSALCGAAEAAWVLLVGRTAQGLGVALTMSAGLGALADRFRGGAARFRAFGVFTTAIGVGMASGPTLGGFLSAAFGWRATFYVHAPTAMLASGMVLLSRVSDSRHTPSRRFDPFGTALATAALALVVSALIESGSLPNAWTAALLVGGMTLGAFFVMVERRTEDVVFDFVLLRQPAFAGAQVTALAYSSAFGALLVFLPRVFEIPGERGSDTAWRAGMAMLPLTAPALIIPLFAARFARRMAPRAWLAGGLLIAAIGAVCIAAVLLREPAHIESVSLTVVLAVTGAGFALSNAHLTNVVMAAIPLARAGVASGMNFTVRQASVALGVAAAGRLYAPVAATSNALAVADVCVAVSAVAFVGAAAAWNVGARCWPNDTDPEPRSSLVGVRDECAAPRVRGYRPAEHS